MTTQLRLVWPPAADFTPDSFVSSDATREAEEALAAWPQWPGRALALVGPEGAGKSHLAAIWAAQTGAGAWLDGGHGGAVLIEDADRPTDDPARRDMMLFRALEAAAAGRVAALLLTARLRPAEWAAGLPDLASRLRALPFAQIAAPDDAALSQILRKLLRDRHLRAPDRVIDYVVRRIERSAPAAREAAAALDRAAADSGGRVSLRLAAQALGLDEGSAA